MIYCKRILVKIKRAHIQVCVTSMPRYDTPIVSGENQLYDLNYEFERVTVDQRVEVRQYCNRMDILRFLRNVFFNGVVVFINT